jgi:hypothetical protein
VSFAIVKRFHTGYEDSKFETLGEKFGQQITGPTEPEWYHNTFPASPYGNSRFIASCRPCFLTESETTAEKICC